MYVKRIAEDNWSGPYSNHIEYTCDNIDQVNAAIRNLNGRNKTEVYFHGDGKGSFSVGGGKDGRYMAFVTIGVDDEFHNLVDPTKSRDQAEVEIVTGGQAGLFPPKQCVTLEMALEAARQFALDGTMSPLLAWEKQG